MVRSDTRRRGLAGLLRRFSPPVPERHLNGSYPVPARPAPHRLPALHRLSALHRPPAPSRRPDSYGLSALHRPTAPYRPPAPGQRAGLPLARTDFVVVDVETTGWLPDEATITEIGAVRFSGGQVTAEFAALVNPGLAIPADITALTGITDAMVGPAQPLAAVLPAFLAFAGDSVLAAHNAPFDVGFLSAGCGSCRIPWPAFAVIDTAVLARLVLGSAGVPDCKLATLAAYFGARTAPCHRALADAKATADVLRGLLGMLGKAGAGPLADVSA